MRHPALDVTVLAWAVASSALEVATIGCGASPALPAATAAAAPPDPPAPDEDGEPTAEDVVPPFSMKEWMRLHGVSDPLPHDLSCDELLASTPRRPELVGCSWVDQVAEPVTPTSSYFYWVSHVVFVTATEGRLKVVFDVADTVGPLDPGAPELAHSVETTVRLGEGGAVIVVGDSEQKPCARALARLVDGRRRAAEANADRRAWMRACAARGTYRFQGGRFVRAR